MLKGTSFYIRWAVFLSKRLMKPWSTTQPTVTLSSGEAKLNGVVRGAAQGLGFQALA